MFYVHEGRNLLLPAIYERRRGRLGSKISGCGQLAEVAVCSGGMTDILDDSTDAVSSIPPPIEH
jgi:hypothetical protein